MKMNTRFIYAIVSFIMAAIIGFVAIPLVNKMSSQKVNIVRIKKNIESGAIIGEDDVEVIKAGGFNLPTNIMKKKEQVIGTYALSKMFPGDYVLSSKISTSPQKDVTLDNIPDGYVAFSISTKSLASSLSNKLIAGDIIRLYYYSDNSEATPVKDIPELRFIKVLSVSDSSGGDANRETKEDEDIPQTSTITLLVTPEQAIMLTEYENSGLIHSALICRNNEKLATELIKRQKDILNKK